MTRRDLLKIAPLAAAPLQSAADNPPQPLLRPALCAYSFRDELKAGSMTYEDLVRLCARCGVDGLDATVYWFPGIANDFLLPLKRTAYRHGVSLYSISIRTEMTQPKPDLRDKEVAWIRNWIDVAERLGAAHIRVFGGAVPKGATEEQAAGWAAEVLQRAAAYAGAKGIILGLENHGGITEQAATIVGIVKQVDSPWVGINLDTGNFRSDVYPQIEQCLPYAVNIQVKSQMSENGRRRPSDWDRMLKMIAASGYRGYLALEYEADEPAPAAVPRLLGDLKSLCRRYSA
jgi:sugar phosphate isomerase/epimerase